MHWQHAFQACIVFLLGNFENLGAYILFYDLVTNVTALTLSSGFTVAPENINYNKAE